MSTYSQPYDNSIPLVPTARRGQARLFGNITGWLIALLLIGAWIAIVDGLSRPYVGEEFHPVTILEYEAHKVTWIFAAVALPFIWLHGRKLKLKFTESYVLWFALCTAASTKDFAYIKIPGAPIYITDISLALVLTSLFLWPRVRIPRLQSGIMRSLAFFLLLGFIAAARGVAGRMDTVDVLRDLSVVVYALFIVVALYASRRRDLAEQFCLMIICGALIATVTGISWYFAQPEMRRYIDYVYVPMAFLLIVAGVMSRRVKLATGIPLLVVLGWGLILSNTRSSYMGLGVSIALLIFLGIGRMKWKELLKPILISGMVLLIPVIALFQTREGQKFVEHMTEQAVTVSVHISQDDNSQWRLLAWAEALRRFAAEPIMGEGFGVPFTFDLSAEDIKPHNIYLYVLYKLGIVGFVTFGSLLFFALRPAWRALRRNPDHPDAPLLRGLFVCLVFLLCFGAVNPLIESPFMASMLWLNMGFMVRCAMELGKDQRPITSNAAAA